MINRLVLSNKQKKIIDLKKVQAYNLIKFKDHLTKKKVFKNIILQFYKIKIQKIATYLFLKNNNKKRSIHLLDKHLLN
jgi:hypothetical protein